MFYFSNPDLVTNILDLNGGNHNANTDEDPDGNRIDEPAFSLNQVTVFELVEPGTFIWVGSLHNAIEPFFIVEIVSKEAAMEATSDFSGQTIHCGE